MGILLPPLSYGTWPQFDRAVLAKHLGRDGSSFKNLSDTARVQRLEETVVGQSAVCCRERLNRVLRLFINSVRRLYTRVRRRNQKKGQVPTKSLWRKTPLMIFQTPKKCKKGNGFVPQWNKVITTHRAEHIYLTSGPTAAPIPCDIRVK